MIDLDAFHIEADAGVPDLLEALEAYLKAPEWVHAPQVVPIWAALSPEGDGPDPLPWGGGLPEGLVEHLTWSLNTWTAFRGRGSLEKKQDRFAKHLPGFVGDVREAIAETGHSSLAERSHEEVDRLDARLDDPFRTFAQRVKTEHSEASSVLPSKTAHLLFPGVIPAYDIAVVENEVLNGLMPPRRRGRRTFRMWLQLTSWCLRRLAYERRLQRARKRVVDHLLGNWSIAAMSPELPRRDEATFRCADSFVAEYILIALSRRGGVRITPGW